MFKKILPWVAGGVIGAVLIYLIKPGVAEKVDSGIDTAKAVIEETVNPEPQVIITEESNAQSIYCPEIQPSICPPVPACVAKIKTKIVYRDRIVHVPAKLKPGCHVNWQTGEVTGSTNSELSLKCIVDWVRKDIREYFYQPQTMPLRRAQRP